jgi:hypothetical protein
VPVARVSGYLAFVLPGAVVLASALSSFIPGFSFEHPAPQEMTADAE